MRPAPWQPPVPLSPPEQAIVKRIRRAKLFVFLREWRHELFDATFQEELAAYYQDSPKGQPPVPPAQLALALILQAYTGVSDDEVIEATTMDRRWQLVLDCHDCAEPPFSKGTLVAFRQRLIDREGDRRLIERTVALAARTGAFGARQLRGRWIAARCGGRAGSRTPITCWATPCGRRWACSRASRGGGWRTWRARRAPPSSAGRA